MRSFQISAVFPHLTGLENVRVALQRKHGMSFDFWRSKAVLKKYDHRAAELLDEMDLGEFADRPAVEMPYGRKRALEIATTIALDPKIMLLDEPMAGMGHEDIDRTAALIKHISAKFTILMVEHNLNVVASLSDKITVLTRGRVLAVREPRGSGGYNLADNDLRVVSEQEKLNQKSAELKRRNELSELRGGRWRILSTLVRRSENWIMDIPAGTAIAMHTVDPQLRGGETLVDGIERLRGRLREVRAEHDRVMAAPWPSAVAKQKLRQQINKLAEAGRPLAHLAIDRGSEIAFPMRSYQIKIMNSDPAAIGFHEAPDPIALLCWLLREPLRLALESEIDAAANDVAALTAEQRQQAAERLLADALELEREESELVWRAQTDNPTILQRDDIAIPALLNVELVPAPPRVPREDDGQFGVICRVGP